jgi:phosphoribosyl-AMP cyclohydrolase
MAPHRPDQTATPPVEDLLSRIAFDRDGLVVAVAQQHDGAGEVLMVAWMNREAVRATVAEGQAVYWSRSRMKLWRKGETSGQVQRLVELRIDCDGDALLLRVHTGRRSCFFTALGPAGLETILEVEVDPSRLYATGA